ncbi:DUF2946 family protein [Acinetobacter johnsonii]|uniref:DUF2946 family protein n=1 Tax=Acinetobacter TaxID=469 RepID=UPI003AF5F30F
MFALLMQALVFLSPLLPHQLQLQDTFCLKLHDVSVHHIENAFHKAHEDSHSDKHDHAECNLCVLHHLIVDGQKEPKLYEVKWVIVVLPDFISTYESINLIPLAFQYPYKQAPPQLIA